MEYKLKNLFITGTGRFFKNSIRRNRLLDILETRCHTTPYGIVTIVTRKKDVYKIVEGRLRKRTNTRPNPVR